MFSLDLQKTFNYVPALWHIDLLDDYEDEEISSGSVVLYFDEDKEDYAYGFYIDLWQHTHNESSPFWGDTRMMAYIATPEGRTYADIEYIQLVEDWDEVDALRYGLDAVA
jgi:hypothetical protein